MLGAGLGKHTYIANGIFGLTCVLVLIEVVLGLYMSAGLLVGVTTTAEYTKFVTVAVTWESFAIAADMTVMYEPTLKSYPQILMQILRASLIGTLLYRRTGFKRELCTPNTKIYFLNSSNTRDRLDGI